MTKQKRNTVNALKALAIKRAIPPGLIAVQLTIQLPHRLVAKVRSATPVERGQMLEAGIKAIGLDRLVALNTEIEKGLGLAAKLAGSIAESHELNARKAVELLKNLEDEDNGDE